VETYATPSATRAQRDEIKKRRPELKPIRISTEGKRGSSYTSPPEIETEIERTNALRYTHGLTEIELRDIWRWLVAERVDPQQTRRLLTEWKDACATVPAEILAFVMRPIPNDPSVDDEKQLDAAYLKTDQLRKEARSPYERSLVDTLELCATGTVSRSSEERKTGIDGAPHGFRVTEVVDRLPEIRDAINCDPTTLDPAAIEQARRLIGAFLQSLFAMRQMFELKRQLSKCSDRNASKPTPIGALLSDFSKHPLFALLEDVLPSGLRHTVRCAPGVVIWAARQYEASNPTMPDLEYVVTLAWPVALAEKLLAQLAGE